MRRYSQTLLAAVAIGLTASVASAADLPRKAPVYVPPAPPPFSWTGFYVGLNAGYGWSNSNSATVTDTFFPLDSAALDQKGNGFIGGGQIGYNWQFAPNWVIGVEGDISGTGIHQTTFGPISIGGVPLGVGFNQMAERDLKWLATARGRFGYAADRWLIYVTGGGAWGKFDYTAGPIFAGVYGPTSFSHTGSGWTVGGGVEYAFTNNWTARVEYLYYNLDGATITNASIVPGFAATQVWNDNKLNVVRAGVNYKF